MSTPTPTGSDLATGIRTNGEGKRCSDYLNLTVSLASDPDLATYYAEIKRQTIEDRNRRRSEAHAFAERMALRPFAGSER